MNKAVEKSRISNEFSYNKRMVKEQEMNKKRKRTHTVWLAGLIICSCLFPAGILKGEPAKDILDASGVKGGLIVHLGCGNAALTAQ